MALNKLLGAGVSGLFGLGGGLLNQKAADKQLKFSKKLAKEGIQMRVNDAKKAGIHPLYALGASPMSFSPISVGGGVGDALSSMGQDVGRAIAAGESAPERVLRDLSVERARAEIGLIRAQTATELKRSAQVGPSVPGGPTVIHGQGDPGQDLLVGGKPIHTDPSTTSGQAWQNRYGEPGEWLGAPLIMWQDFKKNMEGKSFLEILKYFDRMTRIFGK